MSKFKTYLITLAAFLMLLNISPVHAVEVGDKAPDFSLTTLDGEEVTLSQYKGKKAVYLVFWATWCPNCKEEIPNLKDVHAKFGDNIELLAVNTSINDSMRRVKHYVEKHKIPYKVAFDEDSKVTRFFRVMGTPTQVIVDINGVVQYRDALSPDDLGQHINFLMSRNDAE